jgi:hypothetical protein
VGGASLAARGTRRRAARVAASLAPLNAEPTGIHLEISDRALLFSPTGEGEHEGQARVAAGDIVASPRRRQSPSSLIPIGASTLDEN